MKNITKFKRADFVHIIFIVMVGVLVRLPLGHFSSLDTTRLLDPDSYLYARRAVEFSNESLKDWDIFTPRSVDPLMNTINLENDPFTTNLLPIIAACISKIIGGISINTIVYYLCALICPLGSIPVYIFLKKHFNQAGAFVGGLAASLSYAYCAHSTFGFFDTDAIIFVFSLTMLLCHIESIVEKRQAKQVVLCFFALVILVLFSFAWEAYYVYGLIMGIMTIAAFLCKRKYDKSLNLLPPTASTVLMLIYCCAFSEKSAKGSLGRTISQFINGSQWPNESEYISELQHPKLISGGANYSFDCARSGIVNWMGGFPLFLFTLIAIIVAVLMLINSKDFSENLKDKKIVIVLLLVWMAITIPVVPFGIRFVQLLVLPSFALLGVGFSILYDKASDKKLSNFESKLFMLTVAVFVFGALSIINTIVAFCVSLSLVIVLVAIKIKSKKNILILLMATGFLCPAVSEIELYKGNDVFISNDKIALVDYVKSNIDVGANFLCWWNDGYAYQYYLDNAVLADGGIYDGAYFYWLANVFTSEDENLSKGIINMLSTGSIEAVNIAKEYMGSEEKATELLKDILASNRTEAKKILTNKYRLSEKNAEKLLDYSHPLSMSDNYLILSDDDIALEEVIAYFGFWDVELGSSPIEYDKLNEDELNLLLRDSLMTKLNSNIKTCNFDLVYSNDSVSLYKVIS